MDELLMLRVFNMTHIKFISYSSINKLTVSYDDGGDSRASGNCTIGIGDLELPIISGKTNLGNLND